MLGSASGCWRSALKVGGVIITLYCNAISDDPGLVRTTTRSTASFSGVFRPNHNHDDKSGRQMFSSDFAVTPSPTESVTFLPASLRAFRSDVESTARILDVLHSMQFNSL